MEADGREAELLKPANIVVAQVDGHGVLALGQVPVQHEVLIARAGDVPTVVAALDILHSLLHFRLSKEIGTDDGSGDAHTERFGVSDVHSLRTV